MPGVGKVPLNDATLIEDPNELGNQDDDGGEGEASGRDEGMSIALLSDFRFIRLLFCQHQNDLLDMSDFDRVNLVNLE